MRSSDSRHERYGEVAEQYHRSRPRYPADLFDRITNGRRPTVLDVGCGTGIAGLELQRRNCMVLGVEPDERMAEAARANGLTVETSTFEEWDALGRTFDLVTSAHAWHWVDSAIGIPKARRCLSGTGMLAVFWIQPHFEESLLSQLREAYERCAPELAKTSVMAGRTIDSVAEHVEALRGHDFSVAEETLSESTRLSADRYVDLVRTHSDHIALDGATSERLEDSLWATIDRVGGSISVELVTTLLIAEPNSAER